MASTKIVKCSVCINYISNLSVQQLTGPETKFFFVLYPIVWRVHVRLATFLLFFHTKWVHPEKLEHNFWQSKDVLTFFTSFSFFRIVCLFVFPQSKKGSAKSVQIKEQYLLLVVLVQDLGLDWEQDLGLDLVQRRHRHHWVHLFHRRPLQTLHK